MDFKIKLDGSPDIVCLHNLWASIFGKYEGADNMENKENMALPYGEADWEELGK